MDKNLTNTTITVDPGTHKLTLKKKDYVDDETNIEVIEGQELNVTRKLRLITEEELVDAWEVTIESSPAQADIFINNEFTFFFTPATIVLLPGNYTITLKKEGFKDFTQNITLEE